MVAPAPKRRPPRTPTARSLVGARARSFLFIVLRDWALAREARKLVKQEEPPAHVERTYWTGRDYERDSARLALIGYFMVDESHNAPYLVVNPGGQMGYRGRGRVVRRRVPIFHVTYARRGPISETPVD